MDYIKPIGGFSCMVSPVLLRSVLKRITPSPVDLTAEEKMARFLIRKIKSTKGKHLHAILAGSIARNTHLRGDRDLDIFVFYPPTLSRERFEKEGLKLGHSVFGDNEHEEAYSEHPYIRGVINGFNVEIVPTYKVKTARDKMAAVDRTPFHAEYMRKHLSKKQQGEVRLLKQFMKGVSVYGADVKMQGVPGYLAEILILEYGTFVSTLQHVSKWGNPTIVDVEKYYANAPAIWNAFSSTFLVVVDPTDPSRNVAGALSLNQFSRFVASARAFLSKPSESFFFSHLQHAFALSDIRRMLKREEWEGTLFPYPSNILEDVVWGQLGRISKKFAHALERHDFVFRRYFIWTDGKTKCAILFDVENPVLQSSKKRMGPPVLDENACARFLKAHPSPISGPRIEDGRIIVIEKRPLDTIGKALSHEWKALVLTESKEWKPFLQKGETLSESHILAWAKKDTAFCQSLGHYLRGKESFW
ncbi:MAG: CCA tRNA nucleotidyltransferase [Candidatus Diapherotrites archaeon]